MIVHQNYIESSNFMLLSMGLGILNFFFLPNTFLSGFVITTGIFTLIFLAGLAILIRRGSSWIKYLLLVLMIIGLVGIPTIIKNLEQYPAVGAINIIQTALQFWALVLLFKVPNEKAE